MNEDVNQVAVAAIEKKLVDAKREAKDWEGRGLPVPDYLTKKIENLKGAANALRGGKVGEIG